MFEELAPFGKTERSIPLATTKGRPISNVVEVDPPPTHCLNAYASLVRQCGGKWKERKPAAGRYNCAGHVWASRRTCILEVAEWTAIIEDDGYRPLRPDEHVMPGDIAVYVDRDKGDEILHVGMVYRVVEGLTRESAPIPKVISKWNSTSGESLHDAHDVPYHRHFNVGIEFITDRP